MCSYRLVNSFIAPVKCVFPVSDLKEVSVCDVSAFKSKDGRVGCFVRLSKS